MMVGWNALFGSGATRTTNKAINSDSKKDRSFVFLLFSVGYVECYERPYFNTLTVRFGHKAAFSLHFQSKKPNSVKS